MKNRLLRSAAFVFLVVVTALSSQGGEKRGHVAPGGNRSAPREAEPDPDSYCFANDQGGEANFPLGYLR
jgi:hypothetical protein